MKTGWSHLTLGLLCLGQASIVLGQFIRAPTPLPCLQDNSCVKSQPLTPRFFPELKSQRTLVRYGPLPVPPVGTSHTMGDFQFPIPLPCSDCTITQAIGNLEYPNGTTANVNTGLYLHHLVVLNRNRNSTSCATMPELAFAFGNERTPISISANGTIKAGYPLRAGENFVLFAEIMNHASVTRDAVVSIDWEFIPSVPSEFRQAVPVWLDVDGTCITRGSEVPVPEHATSFTLVQLKPWSAQISGDVLVMMSHLHDGGESVEVVRNGQVACNAKARYGERPGYVSSGDHSNHGGDSGGDDEGGHHGGHSTGLQRRHEDTAHISSIGLCTAQGRVEAGDEWFVRANYNLTKYTPMAGAGHHLAAVMGITVLYVGQDPK